MLTICGLSLLLSVVYVLSHVPEPGSHLSLSHFLIFVFYLSSPSFSSLFPVSLSFLEFVPHPNYPSKALSPPFLPPIFVCPPQLHHSSLFSPTSPTFWILLMYPTPRIELMSMESAFSGRPDSAVNDGPLSFFLFHQEQIEEEEYLCAKLNIGACMNATPNSMLIY